jgi:hypothetical protein
MPRTSTATISAWGTPPEPKPTGWDAIRAELAERPGEWANLGDYSTASARKIAKDRFPAAEGYETRTLAADDAEGRSVIWVRFDPKADAAAVESVATTTGGTEIETTEAAPAPTKTGRK